MNASTNPKTLRRENFRRQYIASPYRVKLFLCVRVASIRALGALVIVRMKKSCDAASAMLTSAALALFPQRRTNHDATQ